MLRLIIEILREFSGAVTLKQKQGYRVVLQLLILVTIFTCGLFISAGTVRWPTAWLYLGLIVVSQGYAAFYIATQNPDLAEERTELDTKRDIDKVLAGIMALYGPLLICIVSGLDFRFQWTSDLLFEFRLFSFFVAFIGSFLALWAMTSNRYFYSVLRVEPEKGHVVCDRGPYRIVRHPGYLGAILFSVSAPVMLGSGWGLFPAAVTIISVIVRTWLEDRALQNTLEGYKEYSHKMRYRLLPGVW